MDPVMHSIVWFAVGKSILDTAGKAAIKALEEAGAKLTECRHGYMTYYEGKLQGKTKEVHVTLLHDWKNSDLAKLAEKASHVFLTGALAGRRGSVKLGDVIGVTGCYHIDRGAYIDSDGKKTCHIDPRYTPNDILKYIQELAKANLELNEEMPVSICTRRDWVLDHLLQANKPLPIKEFFDFASNPKDLGEDRNKDWKKVVGYLTENKYVASSDGQLELTEKGIEYCKNNNLEGFFEPSKLIHFHCGPIITSMASHAEFSGKETWKKYDTEQLQPLGLDKDTYDVLGTYPKTIAIKAVENYAGGDKGSKKGLVQQAAAKAVAHIIKKLI